LDNANEYSKDDMINTVYRDRRDGQAIDYNMVRFNYATTL